VAVEGGFINVKETGHVKASGRYLLVLEGLPKKNERNF